MTNEKELRDTLNEFCDRCEKNQEGIMQMLRDWIVNPNEVVELLRRKIEFLGNLVDEMVEQNPESGHSSEVNDINITIKALREVIWLLTDKRYFDNISTIYK